ncbi:Uncharacterised protein [Segatella buccae]|uniref:Uncharacterized protein n=2 Tax=Segatella buccae TaxID=28126 RepID=E6KAE2_9BACT|nr:hypothetical protein [Segatella buccae]EFU29475.1 hypothetical protein HMPREF6485_2578 [Segatella buccae ATCC 33574]SUB96516.1 Uncharacterised protein [Segatella buccae]
MNKNQVMRQTYDKPELQLFKVRIVGHLLEGSTSGGHGSADDDETLTAKKGFFFESEKQTSADRKKLWED